MEHFQGEELTIISPYLSMDAVVGLLGGLQFPRATIVTSWRARDLAAGVSTLDIFEFCQEQGIRLIVYSTSAPKLHAKLYALGQEACWIGSANLTVSGLEGPPRGNRESMIYLEPAPLEILHAVDELVAAGWAPSDEDHQAYREWFAEVELVREPVLPPLPEVAGSPNPWAVLAALGQEPPDLPDDGSLEFWRHQGLPRAWLERTGAAGRVTRGQVREWLFASSPFASVFDDAELPSTDWLRSTILAGWTYRESLESRGARFGTITRRLRETAPSGLSRSQLNDLATRIIAWTCRLAPEQFMTQQGGRRHTRSLVSRVAEQANQTLRGSLSRSVGSTFEQLVADDERRSKPPSSPAAQEYIWDAVTHALGLKGGRQSAASMDRPVRDMSREFLAYPSKRLSITIDTAGAVKEEQPVSSAVVYESLGARTSVHHGIPDELACTMFVVRRQPRPKCAIGEYILEDVFIWEPRPAEIEGIIRDHDRAVAVLREHEAQIKAGASHLLPSKGDVELVHLKSRDSGHTEDLEVGSVGRPMAFHLSQQQLQRIWDESRP